MAKLVWGKDTPGEVEKQATDSGFRKVGVATRPGRLSLCQCLQGFHITVNEGFFLRGGSNRINQVLSDTSDRLTATHRFLTVRRLHQFAERFLVRNLAEETSRVILGIEAHHTAPFS